MSDLGAALQRLAIILMLAAPVCSECIDDEGQCGYCTEVDE